MVVTVVAVAILAAASVAVLMRGLTGFWPWGQSKKPEEDLEMLGLDFIEAWDPKWAPILLVIHRPDFNREDVIKLGDVVNQAAWLWNTTTGVRLFVGEGAWTFGMSVVPVELEWGDSSGGPVAGVSHEGSFAYTRFHLTSAKSLSSASIFLKLNSWKGLDRKTLLNVFGHELGHLLGLGHDLVECSIMHPEVAKRELRVGEKDKMFLQIIYGDRHGEAA